MVCNRPFTWRKKWEDCWDEVTTCSKRCNSERKKANRIARGAAAAEGGTSSDGGWDDSASDGSASGDEQRTADRADAGGKAARKAGKKAAKAEARARRAAMSTALAHGQKACDLCERGVDLLVRCQIAQGKEWKLVCGRCWKTPAVAGGVVDGDGANPHYRYGGLWKNRHRAA